jgi:hypothetical protein
MASAALTRCNNKDVARYGCLLPTWTDAELARRHFEHLDCGEHKLTSSSTTGHRNRTRVERHWSRLLLLFRLHTAQHTTHSMVNGCLIPQWDNSSPDDCRSLALTQRVQEHVRNLQHTGHPSLTIIRTPSHHQHPTPHLSVEGSTAFPLKSQRAGVLGLCLSLCADPGHHHPVLLGLESLDLVVPLHAEAQRRGLYHT